jgi:hypothetical protein
LGKLKKITKRERIKRERRKREKFKRVSCTYSTTPIFFLETISATTKRTTSLEYSKQISLTTVSK